MDINYQLPQIQRFPGWSEYTRQASLQALAPPPVLSNSAMKAVNQQKLNLFKLYLTLQNRNLLLGLAVSSLTGQLSNQVSEGIFGTDTELGQAMGNLFSTGINTAGDQVVNNIFKGESLMNGMGQNVGSSLAGAGAGIAANYIGKGISSLGGNSKLSRGLGAGFATGAGTLGGGALSNIINGERAFGDIADSFKAIKTFNQAKKAADFAKGSPEALEALKASKLGTLNLAGLGASVVGSGLQAAFGPSKEYGGTYGNITKGLDTAYDLVQGAAGFIPGVGTAVSGFMALNKGLSNIFGSTSGMTRQDAILGSAFMPASVKWLNMAGAKTTDKFRNQSWQNQERTNTFMQNGFGDLGEKFDKARRESEKTYGTFSRHAYNKAQGNLNFANDAFNKILDMADDEELRRIRSEYMTSINNQRYAQDITGGFRPLYRGKEGMKIPEINHNFGQRLLSGAALIDNKQMILSAQSGNKIFATNSRGDSYYVSPSALTSNEVNITVPETFITANPDDVAKGNAQRWWREHSNVYNEKGLKQVSPEFDLITLSPLLKPVVNRGFRWTFNKAGLLVKIPLEKTNLFLTSPYTGKWTQFGNREYRFKPGYAAANGVPVESRPVISKVNWDPDYWFKTISGRNSYSAEEASELASNVPEYKEIEKRLLNEGKLIVGSNGRIAVNGSEMSPQEYIIRQSKAFQKMNPNHHYTGVPKPNMEYFEKNPVDVESWSDRISPKNVEEYAFGNFKTRKEILDNIKYFEDLENKNGITESTQDWLKIYRLLLEDFDANIKLMKAKNHGRVYDITYPNDLNTFNMDALGNHWARIPSEIPAKAGVPRRYLRPGEVATDDIVSASNEIEPSIVNIDNVMDTYDGTLLDETIIPRFVPKKSVLGNTGNFDLSKPSLFRSLIPLTVGGSTVATLHNKFK